MPQDVYKSILHNNVRVFLLCCELRNFTSAAKVLGMTPSAVSRAISSLEADLGCTLFLRQSRPLVPTPEARYLRDAFGRMLASFQDAVAQVGLRNHVKPVLRIGILESLTNNLGAALVRRLRPMFSELRLMTASADVLKQRLVERRLDLVVTNDASPESEKNIFCKTLLTEPSVVLLPGRFRGSEATQWTWQRLEQCGLPYIRYLRQCGAGQVNERFFCTQGIVFPDTISVYANSLLVTLVAQGQGWALARPCTVLEMRHLTDRLAIFPCPKPVLMRSVYLVGHRDVFVHEARALYGICLDELRRSIVPELLEVVPWIESQLRVGMEPCETDEKF